MRALKLLVVVLGVLLVGGTVALVAAIVARVEERRAAVPPPTPPRPPGAVPLRTELPEGARILGAELSGERLMVRVALAAGGEEILLFDTRSGALVATIGAATKP